MQVLQSHNSNLDNLEPLSDRIKEETAKRLCNPVSWRGGPKDYIRLYLGWTRGGATIAFAKNERKTRLLLVEIKQT